MTGKLPVNVKKLTSERTARNVAGNSGETRTSRSSSLYFSKEFPLNILYRSVYITFKLTPPREHVFLCVLYRFLVSQIKVK